MPYKAVNNTSSGTRLASVGPRGGPRHQGDEDGGDALGAEGICGTTASITTNLGATPEPGLTARSGSSECFMELFLAVYP